MKNLFIFPLVFISLIVNAQITNQQLPFDSAFIKGKLDNGLTYYIRHNEKPKNKLILRLVFNVGSILETDKQQGLAHYLEHMAFNGTKHFPKNELISYLESIGIEFGADTNAYTGFDETVYMLPVPTDNDKAVKKSFIILSDWAYGINLKDDDIRDELGVILSEKRMRGNNATERIKEQRFPVIFSNSRYKNREPIGKTSVLKTFNTDQIRAFYRDWYRPDLCAVIAVGDYDVKRIKKKIKKLFGKWKAPKVKTKRVFYSIPDNKGTLFKVAQDKELSNTFLEVKYKKPVDTVNTVTDFKRQLTKNMYSGLLNKRLFEVSRKKDAPFISAGNGFGAITRTKSSYSINVNAFEGKIESAFKGLYREMRKMREFGITTAELKRYKKNYLKSIDLMYAERDKNYSGKYVQQAQNNFLNSHPLLSTADVKKLSYQIIPTISVDDVNQMAKHTDTTENRMVIITGPKKQGLNYPDKEDFLNWEQQVNKETLTPYKEEVKTSPVFTEINKPGKIIKERKNTKFDFTELTLSNGAKVFLKPTKFNNTSISLYGYSKGGNSLLDDKHAFSGVYFNALINGMGLGDRNKMQLQRDLAGKSISVGLYLGSLAQNITGYSDVKDFETMLKAAHDYFSRINFDQEKFDSFIAAKKAQAKNAFSIPATFFNNEIRKILTQNHPRRWRVYAPEEIDSVSFDDIKQIYKERFASPGEFHFFMVGNIDIEKYKPLIARYLGSLPNLNKNENYKDLGIRPPKGKIEKMLYYGSEQKAKVRLIFSGETKYSKRKNKIINTLGSIINLRLTDVLREKMGGVYSPYASGTMQREPYASYDFSISFDSDIKKTDTLIKATWKILDEIKRGEAISKDLEKVKAAELQNLKEAKRTNRYWSYLLFNADYFNEPIQTYAEKQNLIKSITSEELIKTAKKIFNKNQYIQFILLPESAKNK